MDEHKPVSKKEFMDHLEEDKRRFNRIDESLKDLKFDIKELRGEVQGIIEVFKAFSSSKKILLGAAIVIGSLVGIVGGIRVIFSWFKI